MPSDAERSSCDVCRHMHMRVNKCITETRLRPNVQRKDTVEFESVHCHVVYQGLQQLRMEQGNYCCTTTALSAVVTVMPRHCSAVSVYGGDQHRGNIKHTLLQHKARLLNSLITRVQLFQDVTASGWGTPKYMVLQQHRCDNVKSSSLVIFNTSIQNFTHFAKLVPQQRR